MKRWEAACRAVSACAGLMLASSLLARAAGPTREEIEARIRELSERVVANPVEGLAAIGPDRQANFDLLAWVREVRARFESLTSLPVPYRVYDLRLVIPETPPDNHPDAALNLEAGVTRPVLVLHLREYELAAGPAGRRALLRAFIAIHMAAAGLTDDAVPPPDWLVEGLLRNLDPVERLADMDTIIDLWQRGGLGPMESLVRGEPAILAATDVDAPALIAAWQGVLVNWITSAPGRRDRFAALFARLAAGGTLDSDWLAGALQGPSGEGLDEVWDRWLLRQRHTVHRLGDFSPRLLRQLDAALLLYPGMHGIPLDVPFGPATPVDAVPVFRTAEWMPGYARRMIIRLERLGAGRHEAFQAVIEAWCDLYRAVLADADAATLRVRIRTARDRQAELDRDLSDGEAGSHAHE